MKFKTYELVTRAVEEHARFAANRILKHTDKPDHEDIVQAIVDEIILGLDEIIDFEVKEDDLG